MRLLKLVAKQLKLKVKPENTSGEVKLVSHHDLSQGSGWNFPGSDVRSEEKRASSNCLDKSVPRFARSASQSLTRARVLSSLARLFAASQVKRLLPNNN